MAFFDFSTPDLRGVAADETENPAVFVIVGEFGTIFYSTGRELDEGFQILTLEQALRKTWATIFDVAFGNGCFIASSQNGQLLKSLDGAAWVLVDGGTGDDLYSICYVSSSTFVAVGYDGAIARTVNLGTAWTNPSSGVSADLYGVFANGAQVMAVGEDGACVLSVNSGSTWTVKTSGATDDLRGVCYGDGKWVIVGVNGWILTSTDGDTFTPRSCPIDTDLYAVAWSGGLFVAVGKNGDTVTSADGITWEEQKGGVETDFLYDVEYLDERFITVGADALIGYSLSGAGRPSFDLFYPISDQYRSIAFAQFGAYMLYVGMRELEEGVWNYYPRRIRNAAPGSVNDFESVGHFFTDLPGKGALLDAVAVRGGIVLAESDQLSLLTDGGSTTSPWMYHQKFGEGLRMISNLCSLNGMAYGIATDGLIYRATVNGVERLGSFFDLTEFDDFNPGSEVAWIGFDATFQNLFVFRPESPWVIFLVNDDTGGVTELEVPFLTIGEYSYTPLSVFTVQGQFDGLHISYATDETAISELVIANLDLSGPITGIDSPDDAAESHVISKIETGSFRLTSLGARGDLRELRINTWADPDSTVRPDMIVRMREEPEDDWQTEEEDIGTITVGTSSCTGVGTTWSRRIGLEGEGPAFTLPWLVDQCEIFIENITLGTRLAATYTKTDDFDIELETPLPAGYALYVNPGPARPFVKGRVGDYIESDEGYHRIVTVNTAYDLELDWYPSEESEGKYLPAQEIPEGGPKGDGRLVFGLGRGFDQIMIQVLMVAHSGCDATGAKILEMELGYKQTGREMETDNA